MMKTKTIIGLIAISMITYVLFNTTIYYMIDEVYMQMPE